MDLSSEDSVRAVSVMTPEARYSTVCKAMALALRGMACDMGSFFFWLAGFLDEVIIRRRYLGYRKERL